MASKTYHGSCHCGAVRYEVDLDLSQGSNRCNCSICWKTRNWSTAVKPEQFRLLAGADDLTDYQFATKSGHHVFCKHCGVRPFGYGHVKEIGGDYYSIKLNCLDDVGPEDLADVRIQYLNGRDDNWDTPADTRHL